MPEYLAPGVYVEEVDTGNKPIEGVSTSTAGFVGKTVRGKHKGLPELITSFGEFRRVFGGYLDIGTPAAPNYNHYLPHAVEAFFSNGGKRCYVLRVLKSDATLAKTTALGGVVTRLAQSTDGSVATTTLKLASLHGIQKNTTLRLRMIKQGVATDSADLTVDAYDRANATVTLAGAGLAAGPSFEDRLTVVLTDVKGLKAAPDEHEVDALATPADARSATIDLSAKDEGAWGRQIAIQTAVESSARGEFDSLGATAANDNKVKLKSATGFYVNAWVEIDRGEEKSYRKCLAVNGLVITLSGPAMAGTDIDPVPATGKTVLSTREFRLNVSYDGVTESHSGLTLENVPGRYVVDRLTSDSELITAAAPSAANTNPFLFPTGAELSGSGGGLLVRLDTDGNDGTNPAPADYQGGGDPGERTGIAALEDIDQISIIAAPGLTNETVQGALINQCERLKDRFAVLDPMPAAKIADITAQRQTFDTKYAAIYYPQVTFLDPRTDVEMPCPPSGHIVGIYARTDIERGVHKAPANETIRAITGLERVVNHGQQEILNPSPNNINVLRDFRASGRGYRVWGARCITSDPDWKYVPVRRLFIYLEESIDEGTQWVVFEPNDEPLWARVRASVSAFLRNIWRDGALQGLTPEEAYFVQCDRSTMSQADIDNGRLIMRIGVAPVKPAEFVIFRIGQWAGGGSVEEG